MGLYDRNYMRYEAHSRRGNPLYWLLGTLVGVYVLQTVVGLIAGARYLEAYGALSLPSLLEGFIWTPFTYALIHDPSNPFHLLMNGLVLFFVGRFIQERFGNRRLIWGFVWGCLAGGVAFLLVNAGQGVVIGASAGVSALVAMLCLATWNENITALIAFIPVTLPGRYLLYGLLGLEGLFLLAELGGQAPWAASAHLGGIGAGYLYFRMGVAKLPLFPRRKAAPRVEPPAWMRKQPKSTAEVPRYKVNVTDRRQLQAEVDRILDKINSRGFGSLSDEEKRILDRARDILNR